MINPISVHLSLQDLRDRKLRQVSSDNERTNRKRIAHSFKDGELVYLHNDVMNRSKLHPVYLGPYKIDKVNPNGTVVLQRETALETVNIRKLLPAGEVPAGRMSQSNKIIDNCPRIVLYCSREQRSHCSLVNESSSKMLIL